MQNNFNQQGTALSAALRILTVATSVCLPVHAQPQNQISPPVEEVKSEAAESVKAPTNTQFLAFEEALKTVNNKLGHPAITTTKASVAQLTELVKNKKPEDAVRFTALRDQVLKVTKKTDNDTLLSKLPKAVQFSKDAYVILKLAYTPFEGLRPEQFPDLKVRIAKVQQDYKATGETIANVAKLPDQVEAALTSTGTNLKEFLEGWTEKSKNLALLKNADAPVLLTSLGAPLNELAQLVGLRRAFEPLIELQKALAATQVANAAVPDTKFTDLDENLGLVLSFLASPWLNTLADAVQKRDAQALEAFLTLVESTDAGRYANQLQARTAVVRRKEDLTALTAILTALKTIRGQVQRSDFPAALGKKADLEKLSVGVEELQVATTRLDQTVALLASNQPADLSRWVSDQITLYYFDNVAQMMQVLNKDSQVLQSEEGKQAQQNAAQTRRTLVEATLALVDQKQTVNNARSELQNAREELRQARFTRDDAAADLEKNDSIAERAGLRRQTSLHQLEFQRDRAKADRDFIQRQLDAATTDTEKKPIKEKLNLADRQVALLDAQVKLVQADNSTITTLEQGDATELGDEVTQAQSKLDAAATRLQTAETAEKSAVEAVAVATKTATTAALAASENFATTRDQPPFWRSVPQFVTSAEIAASTTDTPATTSTTTSSLNSDPVQRVMLYGFPNERTIFIRGAREDVRRVKDMIMSFDVPKTQTLLTLHSLEISSKDDPKGAEQTAAALQLIQRELAVSRLQTEAALSLLRECVATQVQKSVAEFRLQQSENGNGGLGEFTDDDLAAVAFYDSDVLREFGWETNSELLVTVTPLTRGNVALLNSLVPRPGTLSTLAEALAVLSLAKSNHQLQVWKEFKKNVSRYTNEKTRDLVGDQAHRFAVSTKFPNLGLLFGDETLNKQRPKVVARNATPEEIEDQRSHPGSNITNLRRELTTALVAHGLPKMVNYIKSLAQERKQTEQKLIRLGTQPPSQAKNILTKRASDHYSHIENQIPLAWIHRNYPLSDPYQVLEYYRTRPTEEIVAEFRSGDPDGQAKASNARTAAANEVLKKQLTSINEDLDQQFVQPMLARLQKELRTNAGVGVGVLQSTSVLGVNRLQARVDPVASAQMGVGQEQNALQLLTALSLIQSNFAPLLGGSAGGNGKDPKTLSVQAGTNLLGKAGAAAAPAPAAALALLGAVSGAANQLDRLPREAPPGVYGVTTGNTFQVTPITDPSGQALRFRLDHVLSTQIREPNNSVNPQLSRIERHGINTEVQLSNHEIRLASKFDATSRLGVPKRRSGGIPILKDIPVVKELPLVGWFVRRGGKAATVQQTIVLAQATIFPTIGDIIELMPRSIHTISVEPGIDQNVLPRLPRGYILNWDPVTKTGKVKVLGPGSTVKDFSLALAEQALQDKLLSQAAFTAPDQALVPPTAIEVNVEMDEGEVTGLGLLEKISIMDHLDH